jgi:predicted DsbA family dithiol-disulfide isomerase
MCHDDEMRAFTIDVWSDLICPFCAIGRQHLLRALERFDHRDEVVLRYHAFELDPGAPRVATRSADELVARKYGLTLEHARRQHERLEAEAASVGLQWDFRRARPSNTFDAHRLLAAARAAGQGDVLLDRLYQAYFTEGAVLGDPEVLETIGAEVGLRNAAAVVRSDQFADDVRADEADALDRGVSGVPSMLVDGRFLVVGARSADDVRTTLDRAWARRQAD